MLYEVIREIHLYGADSAMIPRLLRTMVEDLVTAAADHSLPAVERARGILDDETDEDRDSDTANV